MRRKPEDFLRDADTAMYRAKESGKARYEIFDHEMHVRNMNLVKGRNRSAKSHRKRRILSLLPADRRLETGEIHEFEALIRWEHPENGMIMPNDFIYVAEETGFDYSDRQMGSGRILPPDERVANDDSRRQKTLSISVNLSAKQLMHPSLTAQVKEILQKPNSIRNI